MTTSVPGMRPNKPVSMDIDQLRGWASLMDRAMVASLAVTILGVTALGVTTFLSFRYGAALRTQELAALDHYKHIEDQASLREKDAASARERAAALEKEIVTARARATTLEAERETARGRTATLEQELARAREQAAALAQEAAQERARAAALEQTAREATERAAQATQQASRDSAAARPAAPAPLFDASEIRRRLADLGKMVRDAAPRAAPTPPPQDTATAPQPASPPAPSPASAAPVAPTPPSAFVESVRRFAGTPAAIFLLGQISEAPAIGSALSADLRQAGWKPETWSWGGVGGIYGVVVLVRDGSRPATHEAAAGLVEALRAAGFNASKGDWPAPWGRFRGTLNGPETPAPTDAAIRIVVGEKARAAP